MIRTFRECENLKILDLSNFDFTHVTTMIQTFMESYQIEEIKLGNSATSSLENI